jgi:hypothetical protein
MATPTNVTRGTPAGIPLEDGFSTKLAIAGYLTLKIQEKTVTPPGMEGGDPIPVTTMHNTTWRTFRARDLITLTPITVVAAYDPDVYSDDQVQSVINLETNMTLEFPDGSDLDFFGFVQNWMPSENSEGVQPEGTMTIVPTCYDPTNDVEAGPVLTEVAGT